MYELVAWWEYCCSLPVFVCNNVSSHHTFLLQLLFHSSFLLIVNKFFFSQHFLLILWPFLLLISGNLSTYVIKSNNFIPVLFDLYSAGEELFNWGWECTSFMEACMCFELDMNIYVSDCCYNVASDMQEVVFVLIWTCSWRVGDMFYYIPDNFRRNFCQHKLLLLLLVFWTNSSISAYCHCVFCAFFQDFFLCTFYFAPLMMMSLCELE